MSDGQLPEPGASIAYFTMEIALEPGMPTYSGGLGVLAGDTVRTAADLGLGMIAVSLLHRQGYFDQSLDADGNQLEAPQPWPVASYLEELHARATVRVEGREVVLRAWRYRITGSRGHVVPVLFLDADLPDNAADDRRLTDSLYGGDDRYRLAQEMLLGIGGVRMLRALGYDAIRRFHMNEGHAALLTLELLEEAADAAGVETIGERQIADVRARCVFTTHTPVPAGHDQFPLELAYRLLGPRRHGLDVGDALALDVYRQVLRQGERFESLRELAARGVQLNLTYVALNLSRYVNGVARRHGEVSSLMFADYAIDAITNGVHAASWTAGPMAELFDAQLPGWREDNFSLRYALGLDDAALRSAREKARAALRETVRDATGVALDPQALTLGFARRATAYKRTDLLFQDPERLRRIVRERGPLQAVFAGKAHPRDERGRELIRAVHAAARALHPDVTVVYLPGYDTALAKTLIGGVDVWLNTPLPPNEASGTSGMKAALNGVPSLSTLDGWWLEGHLEGVTGWAIDGADAGGSDADGLYTALERSVLPCFHDEPARFTEIMRHAIALNGSFFNSQRMLQQYVLKAYDLQRPDPG